MDREAYCKVVVIAAGDELMKTAVRLEIGQIVEVSGFVTRADSRQGQGRLILHAQRIELG